MSAFLSLRDRLSGVFICVMDARAQWELARVSSISLHAGGYVSLGVGWGLGLCEVLGF